MISEYPYVPNEMPSLPVLHSRLAIITDHPRSAEVLTKRPLMAANGGLLERALASAQLARSSCMIGQLCQYQPPNSVFTNFDHDEAEVVESKAQLKRDLHLFKPNCILLLGDEALAAAGVYHKAAVYRGTIFKCELESSPFYGFKCVAAQAPDKVLKNFKVAPLFNFDVNRAVKDSSHTRLDLPTREFELNLTPSQAIARIADLPKHTLISFDIEGGVLQDVSCIGIATEPGKAFILPLRDYAFEERVAVLKAFARIMADKDYPKLLQYSLYDTVVLSWLYQMPINNVLHDTLLSAWEIYPEMDKDLGTQASLWTRQPYYKSDRKSDSSETFYRYCCTDACVTLEIHLAQLAHLSKNPAALRHYKENVQLLKPLLYMSLKGIKYDEAGAKEKQKALAEEQAILHQMTQVSAGVSVNLNSYPQMRKVLYETLGLPRQYAIEAGRKTSKLATDSTTLLKLAVKTKHPFLLQVLNWRKLEGARRQLSLRPNHDNRIRCSYNLVGAETGRLSCAASNTGSGSNLQTIMKENRQFYVADEGYYFFQCDLSGADGWTVAARAKALGDSTMFDDYMFGLKPAKIIAAMHLHGATVSRMPRDELRDFIKSMEMPEGLYDITKAVQHGSNYLMGGNRMSENLLEKSFKKSVSGKLLSVPPKDCKLLQDMYFLRYPGVKLWHADVLRQLRTTHTITSASGNTRSFFGSVHESTTHKAALAHEPQNNTSYANNLALARLWNDPENRNPDGFFIIQPLHSVHDAVCGQFPTDRLPFAKKKLHSYFDNPITIGSETFVIPFEGGYGSSWYDTDADTNPI